MKCKCKVMGIMLLFFTLVGSLCTPATAYAAKKPKLNRSSITLTVGQKYKLKVKNNKKKITWKSSKKSIATVSKTGKVTAKKKGTCKITAKFGKKKLVCKVTVKKKSASSSKVSNGKSNNTSNNNSNSNSNSNTKDNTNKDDAKVNSSNGTNSNNSSDTSNNENDMNSVEEKGQILINGEPAKDLEITLYSKPTFNGLEMPSDLQTAYPLVITGYKDGYYLLDETYLNGVMKLDDNQCIPATTAGYDYDEEVQVVVDGNVVSNIIIHRISYQKQWYSNKIKEIVSSIITDDMTGEEKVTAVTRYVAENYSYSVKYSSAFSMVFYGAGDCWASTDLVISLLDEIGIENRWHQENGDAWGGHSNAVAYVDGVVYELEAGYTGTAPRTYDVTNIGDGLICRARWADDRATTIASYSLADYEAFDVEDVVLPEEFKGLPLSAIVQNAFYYGVHYGGIKISSIKIPKTVDYIGMGAFYGIDDLKSITVDEESPYFTAKDNLLYSKDMTTLYYIAEGQYESVTIPDSVTEIKGYCSAWDEGLKNLTLSSNIKTIGKAAFWATGISSITLPEGLETIEDGAFSETNITEVVVPESVTNIGAGAFESYTPVTITVLNKDAVLGDEFVYTNATIKGYKGSTAETYANENEITFVALDE